MLTALASGNTQEMVDAAAALRQQKTAAETVDTATLQLMSQLGITPGEVGWVDGAS